MYLEVYETNCDSKVRYKQRRFAKDSESRDVPRYAEMVVVTFRSLGQR